MCSRRHNARRSRSLSSAYPPLLFHLFHCPVAPSVSSFLFPMVCPPPLLFNGLQYSSTSSSYSFYEFGLSDRGLVMVLCLYIQSVALHLIPARCCDTQSFA